MTISINDLDNQDVQINAIILNGGTTSGVIDKQGFDLVGLVLPGVLTSTALSLLVSVDGSNFVTLVAPNGNTISYVTNVSTYLPICETQTGLSGFETSLLPRFFKIVMGSAEGAARTIVCNLKPSYRRKP